MKIDPTTLMFYELSDEQACELHSYAVANMRGTAYPLPEPAKEWMRVGGFDESRGLLVVSTVLPMRIFASLLLREQERTIRVLNKIEVLQAAGEQLKGEGANYMRMGIAQCVEDLTKAIKG